LRTLPWKKSRRSTELENTTSTGKMPAPAHDKTGHTWHHTDKALLVVTKLGLKPFAGENYESDMPAFEGILRDEEIESILAYIKSTWPERERAYQKELTEKSKVP
jgi:hypothetical protein